MILAGGTSRRWGGREKTALLLGGRPVLEHVVRAVLPETSVVAVVAPDEHPARADIEALAGSAARPLVWTREDPPGGGPCAGVAAGVSALAAEDPDSTVGPGIVLVLAGDLPFARTALPRLLEALTDSTAPAAADVAVGVDPQGRRQPLLAAYRSAWLRGRLAEVDPAGAPLRVLLTGAEVAEVPVTADEALDLDTPEAAEEAARLLANAPRPGAAATAPAATAPAATETN